MKLVRRVTILLTVLMALPVGFLRAADEPIDFDRARQIHEHIQHGEPVTAEERAYLERARKARQEGNRPPAPPKWTQHLTPLTELGTAKYKGEDGGLYGGGKNEPAKAHLAAAMKEEAKIRPLDADGNPSPNGRIGLLSVGMSNTTQEFSQFAAQFLHFFKSDATTKMWFVKNRVMPDSYNLFVVTPSGVPVCATRGSRKRLTASLQTHFRGLQCSLS